MRSVRTGGEREEGTYGGWERDGRSGDKRDTVNQHQLKNNSSWASDCDLLANFFRLFFFSYQSYLFLFLLNTQRHASQRT